MQTVKLMFDFVVKKMEGYKIFILEVTSNLKRFIKNPTVFRTCKKLLYSKRSHQQNEKAMEWEKIFAKRVSDKGLISKIPKEII